MTRFRILLVGLCLFAIPVAVVGFRVVHFAAAMMVIPIQAADSVGMTLTQGSAEQRVELLDALTEWETNFGQDDSMPPQLLELAQDQIEHESADVRAAAFRFLEHHNVAMSSKSSDH